MEQLSFKITLDCEYHPDFQKEPPVYRVILNNHVVDEGYITEEKVIEFTADCKEHNELCIGFAGKTVHDVVLGDDGLPVKDKLLKIKSIEIDEIQLKHLLQTLSVYDAGEYGIHRACVDLGWNGEWKFEFNTPWYIFLLENL